MKSTLALMLLAGCATTSSQRGPEIHFLDATEMPADKSMHVCRVEAGVGLYCLALDRVMLELLAAEANRKPKDSI